MLPDGSLLVSRIGEARRLQLFHFWPDTGRVQPLRAFWDPDVGTPLFRPFPDGKEAVFFGRPDPEPSAGGSDGLYALDLQTGRSRSLGPIDPIYQGPFPGGLAASADNRSILLDQPAGSLHRLVSLPRDGRGPRQTLATFTDPTGYIDASADGSIYVDQYERRTDALRFTLAGGRPEVLTTIPGVQGSDGILALSDGRVVTAARIAGRLRLLVSAPGGSPVPLLDANEETLFPAIELKDGLVALVAGSGANQRLAVASPASGRIVAHFDEARHDDIHSMAASTDGSTLFYSAGGSVWSIPVKGGTPRKVHAGDSVVVDPANGDLIVEVFAPDGARLVRVPAAGGTDTPIPSPGQIHPALIPLGAGAVDRQGRLLVTIASADRWYWSAALLTLATGALERIPVDYEGDILVPGWTTDGRIVANAAPLRSSIWRLKPATPAR